MRLLDALQYDEGGVRLLCGDRWLLWDDGDFVVYERKYGKHETTTLIRTNSESDAVKILLEVPA